MNPELGRSGDHGEEFATGEQAVEPATSPEAGPPADGGDALAATGVAAAEPATSPEPGQAQPDGPLLGDAGLRAGWERIQAGFVDDPRAAVADAADLVEHAAQAFVGALQQRQRRLRGSWNGDRQQDGAAEQVPDTERLRLVMQRYRSLFDQLSRP